MAGHRSRHPVLANLKIPQGANIYIDREEFASPRTEQPRDHDHGCDDFRRAVRVAGDLQLPRTTTLSDRTVRDPLAWSVPAWASGPVHRRSGETPPELKTLLQPLVAPRSDWTDSSSLVLRFDGVAGHRRASSYDDAVPRAPPCQRDHVHDRRRRHAADLRVRLGSSATATAASPSRVCRTSAAGSSSRSRASRPRARFTRRNAPARP